MPDRRVDPIARQRIEAIQQGYETFAHRVYVILLVLFVVTLGAAVGTLYLRGQNEQRAEEARALAARADRLAKQIQDERADATRQACEERTRRNRAAKRKLHKLHFPPPAETATSVLLDALSPVQNCDKLVDRRVGEEDG